MRDKFSMAVIRISLNQKNRIEKLAKKLGLKQITVLEYLLTGKLRIEDLN